MSINKESMSINPRQTAHVTGDIKPHNCEEMNLGCPAWGCFSQMRKGPEHRAQPGNSMSHQPMLQWEGGHGHETPQEQFMTSRLIRFVIYLSDSETDTQICGFSCQLKFCPLTPSMHPSIHLTDSECVSVSKLCTRLKMKTTRFLAGISPKHSKG